MMKQARYLSLVVIAFSNLSHAATIASVNGKVITDDDLKSQISNLPEAQKQNILKDQGARNQVVQSMIEQELMVQDAVSKKIEDSKEYKEAVNNFKKQALVNLLVQKQLAPKVTDAGAKEYFNKNKGRYPSDQVKVQHILASSEKEALEILSEVKKPGADFQKIAETRSKDPSAKNNRGDVGYFTRDMYDQAFSDASFGTKTGDIVGPVKTSFGYHIIKVIDHKAGRVPDYVEIEQKVRTDLQRDLLQKYVSDLRKKAKIKM